MRAVQSQTQEPAPRLVPGGHGAHPPCHRKTPPDLFWLSTHEVVTKSSSTFCRQKTWTSAEKKKKMTSPRSWGTRSRDVTRTQSQWLESCRAALAAQERDWGGKCWQMAGPIGISPPNLTCCLAGTIQAGKRSKLHSPACTAKRPELLESLL